MTYLDDMALRVEHLREMIRPIKLVVFDVDGVLTDGSLLYGPDGESLKRFNVKDGVGLKLLQDVGIQVAIVSAKSSPMVASRMKDLGIQHFYPETKNKLKKLNELAETLQLQLENCAFVGDDMVDVKPMQACGLSFCPADAYPMVKEVATQILGIEGGQGVAREVCDLILAGQGLLDQAYNLTTQATFERKR